MSRVCLEVHCDGVEGQNRPAQSQAVSISVNPQGCKPKGSIEMVLSLQFRFCASDQMPMLPVKMYGKAEDYSERFYLYQLEGQSAGRGYTL